MFSHRNKPASKSRFISHSFTLIELIVVVAVLTVLITLLSPALNKMLESSMSITCANNLRLTFQGIANYAEDNDAYLPGPSGVARPHVTNSEGNLADFLSPYLDVVTDGGQEHLGQLMCPINTEDENLKRTPYSRAHFYMALRLDHEVPVSSFSMPAPDFNTVVLGGTEDSTRPFGSLYDIARGTSGMMPMRVDQLNGARDRGLYDAFNVGAIQQHEQGVKTLYPGYPAHFKSQVNTMYLDGHIDQYFVNVADFIENNRDLQKMW